MNGIYLMFFVQENHRHGGELAYEWLLQEARRLGLKGGSAFKAIAGFGRHGVLHADHFIELAGDLPVEVAFMATAAEVERLLASLRQHGLSLVYVQVPASSGVTVEPGAS